MQVWTTARVKRGMQPLAPVDSFRNNSFPFRHPWKNVGTTVSRAIRFLPLLVLAVLPACQTAHFYRQAMAGQAEIFWKSRPIPKVLVDPHSSPALREKLRQVEHIRAFASAQLGLPGEKSYGTYADLGREHVTWVLYAAPEFSLKPKTWWYPTLGHLDYRGFFTAAEAEEFAQNLRYQHYDVEVGGTDAYSTLGWFHDPVLNCFIGYPEIDLAELLFHEYTHRRLFRDGDTAFNEALATAYAEHCVKQWLRAQHRFSELDHYQKRLVRRDQFYQQIDHTRRRLEALYASDRPPAEMRRGKKQALQELQNNFRELRRRWGGHGLESWLEEDLNNAHLVSIITYQQKLPQFRALLKECGGEADAFFRRAEKMK